MARRATECHHGIRRGADMGFSLDRIPEQITGDEYIGAVGEQHRQAPLNHHDVLELPGVIRQGFAIALRVHDRLERRGGKAATGSVIKDVAVMSASFDQCFKAREQAYSPAMMLPHTHK